MRNSIYTPWFSLYISYYTHLIFTLHLFNGVCKENHEVQIEFLFEDAYNSRKFIRERKRRNHNPHLSIRASPTHTNFYTISSKLCKIQLQPTPFLTPFHQNLVQMNSATPNLVFHYSCTILLFLVLLFNF